MKKPTLVNVLLILILSLAISSTTLYAQERNLKTELLVYILPDSLELPQMEKGMVSIENIGKIIGSRQLHSALVSTKASKIGRAFPQWATEDSVVVRSDGEQVKAPAFQRIFIVTFDSEKAAENAIAVLSKLPSVLFAERHAEPVLDNDPSYLDGTQWYLNNDGRLGGVVGADINAETAWGIFAGSSAVKIAIIDSGIDLNHTEFSGRVSGDAHTGNNHGTLVAGVAAANAMNGEGMRGVDWNAQIISKKNSNSNGYWLGDNVVAQKITDAVAEGANVLNCSWSFANTLSTTLKMAFHHAYQMDRLVVATMGNTGTTQKRYPSGYRNVIAVGATQNNDVRSPFSTMGTHIDVVAPGGIDTVSTNPRNIFTTTTGGGYTFSAGTSFAAPQVAGLASLLKGFNSNQTNDDIRQIIKLTADQVPDMNGEPFTTRYGYGRINAGRALQMVRDNDFLHSESYGGTSVKTNFRLWLYEGDYWNLNPGMYANVDRYEVTKRVHFDTPFCSPPIVWFRERTSQCLNGTNPNDGFPYAEITNVTETGFDVKYYVFYVRASTLGVVINRWIPANVSNSKVDYTAVGELNIAGNAGPISGPTTVCTSNTTFTLNNMPAGCTVSWSHDPALLTYVSGQFSPSYTVKAASSSSSGTGWVQAVVSGPCGDAPPINYEVWVGAPSRPTEINGFPYNGMLFGSNSYYYFSVYPPSIQGVSIYEWVVGGGTITDGQGTNNITALTGSGSDEMPLYFDVSVRVGNSCGLSPWLWRSGYVMGGVGPARQEQSLTVSPNPTTSSFTVAEVEPANDNIPWTLRLMSQRGAVMVNVTSTLPKTISVQGLQPGVYVLHARRGEYVEQLRVVVE